MTPRNLQLILFCYFALLSVAFSKVEDCGSVDGTWTGLAVNECDGSFECVVKRGRDATLTINFTSRVTSRKVTPVIHGILGPLEVPFPVPQETDCPTSVTCPIQPDELYTYQGSFPVEAYYPEISVKMKLELRDDAEKDLVCLEVPVRVSA